MSEIKKILSEASVQMKKAVEHLEIELNKIRTGKASPVMLESVKVDYYGTPTPLNQVANITATDAKTLTVQAWEKNLIPVIEKAIRDANLGFNPTSDGSLIRILVPTLTEERRKELVKQAKQIGEEAKVAVRNIRRDYNEKIKKLTKAGVPEDEVKAGENEMQKQTDSFIAQIDAHLKQKEAEIMKV
ncbi:MAG: ribosome recycling factor [Bacteroidia bacterium]|nr:ribosome recycling factor [Bacteroidia bacterium]MDW8345518.1 ribosome recycling factor [Bacteroidia bacterium]